VVIVQNIVVAFILEAYISQRNKNGKLKIKEELVTTRTRSLAARSGSGSGSGSGRGSGGGSGGGRDHALSPVQKKWMSHMYSALNFILQSDEREDAINLSTNNIGDTVVFTFERKQVSQRAKRASHKLLN